MTFPISGTQRVPTSRQVPDHSIMDYFNKQTYLGNAFTLPIMPQTLAGTSETLVALIKNPATIGSVQNTISVFNNLRTTASDNAGGDGTTFFKYYANPTVSSTGTATLPVNLRLASSTTSVTNCYLNGQFTVSGNGTLIRAITAGYSSINDSILLIILDPGQTMLITATAVTAASIIIDATSWYEL